MAQRKLQQEIDKCFKNVDIGVESFDSLYDKYDQSGNAAQREKAVEALKTQCKKLQRLRDQIKQWAASNEVKDKGPLQDKRELIESKMEAFKAVEKEMKTKAFSKEGLLISSKADPKEQEKEDIRSFLGDMVDELGRQIEEAEAETDQLQAQTKKKKDSAKVERLAELEERTERHKWHQNKLELLMRALANDRVEPDDIKNRQEDIQHYVDNNREVDFYEDEEIYDEFDLQEDGPINVGNELDKVSSQDAQSMQEEVEPGSAAPDATKTRQKSVSEATTGTIKRPSQHIKSPLPALATLHNLPAATPATVNTAANNMKPAPLPTKPAETLNYRSAAAAGAANDAAGIGIAPLPPPPGKTTPAAAAATPVTAPDPPNKSSATASPAPPPPAQPASIPPQEAVKANVPAPSRPISKPSTPSQSSVGPSPAVSAAQLAQASARDRAPTPATSQQQNGVVPRPGSTKPDSTSAQNHDRIASLSSLGETAPMPAQPNGTHAPVQAQAVQPPQEDESVFHLPASLQELVDCFEEVRNSVPPTSSPAHHQLLSDAFARAPSVFDSDKPRPYKPETPATYTPPHYPKQPSTIFDDPRLYSRVDQDALFYSFYYRQGTYQQYLAAKELKTTSWRFHKMYQTWFQRHEEPQQITEEYERGTYRFFDYESTWMNRRKADFKFEYRYLEDEVL